jgi:hypothetical protein
LKFSYYIQVNDSYIQFDLTYTWECSNYSLIKKIKVSDISTRKKYIAERGKSSLSTEFSYRTHYRAFKPDELDQYLEAGLPSSIVKENPLHFWSTEFASAKFPLLKCLARKILSIPATSSGTERLFSFSGIILNNRRQRLSPDQVDNMLVIKSARQVLSKIKQTNSTNKWLFFLYNILICYLLGRKIWNIINVQIDLCQFSFLSQKSRYWFYTSDSQTINLGLIHIWVIDRSVLDLHIVFHIILLFCNYITSCWFSISVISSSF